MEGELKKWTNYISGWQPRHCVIKGELFYYFNKKGDPPRSKVHLAISRVEDSGSTKFEIDTGCISYFFKAKSVEEKTQWLQAFKAAKFQAEKSIIKGGDNKKKEEAIEINIGATNSLTFPEKLSYIRNLAHKLSTNNTEIHRHLAENYDLGQDEASTTLLNMLSNNKHDGNVFQHEFDQVIAKLSEFSVNINSINAFLNSGDNEVYKKVSIVSRSNRQSFNVNESKGIEVNFNQVIGENSNENQGKLYYN